MSVRRKRKSRDEKRRFWIRRRNMRKKWKEE